ncbi:MAG: hypothetical protein N2234_03405 [Planctomycetota bacterium]|nr:hypothetical protein [Planctomycetota bacterium]
MRRRSGKHKPPLFKLFYRHLLWWSGKLIMLSLAELPLQFTSFFFSIAFLFWYYVFRKFRHIAVEQLKEALKINSKEAEGITKKMFLHLGRNFAEFLAIARNPRRIVLSLVDGEEFKQKISEALKQKKGVIVVTGHIGNWELLGAYSAQHFPTAVIAKKIYFNKYDKEISSRRRKLKMSVIYQEEGIRPLLEALHKNSVVGILADQDIKRAAGDFVQFFGKPAYTVTAPSTLSLKSGAPLFVAALRRTSLLKHKIFIVGPITILPSGDRNTDRINLTQTWTTVLENIIRQEPSQWVWFHKRWNTRPEEV